MTLLIILQQLHHQFAMTSNTLSSSHPYYSYLQTVHHAIVDAMVRLLTERDFHCGHKRTWTSQPHIRDTPAGNIFFAISQHLI